jgi:hypothetical protein
MSRREKLEGTLRSTEEELRRRLRSALPHVVDGYRSHLFCNSEFNPLELLEAHRDPESEVLLDLAKRTQRLRGQLGLVQSEGPGQLFIDACRESADLDDEHRLGPRRLAERLLRALQGEGS